MIIQMLKKDEFRFVRKENETPSEITIEAPSLYYFLWGKYWSYPLFDGELSLDFSLKNTMNAEYAKHRNAKMVTEYIRVIDNNPSLIVVEVGFIDSIPTEKEEYPPEKFEIREGLVSNKAVRIIPTKQFFLMDDQSGFRYNWLFHHFGVRAEVMEAVKEIPTLFRDRSGIVITVKEWYPQDYEEEVSFRKSNMSIRNCIEDHTVTISVHENDTPYYHVGAALIGILPAIKNDILKRIQDIQAGKVEDISPYINTRVKYVTRGAWTHFYMEGFVQQGDVTRLAKNFSIGSRTPNGFHYGSSEVTIPYEFIPAYLEHMWNEIHRDGIDLDFGSRFEMSVTEFRQPSHKISPDEHFVKIMGLIRDDGHIASEDPESYQLDVNQNFIRV